MKIDVLQAGLRGPVLDLQDARGLVAFVADGGPLWGEFMSSLREGFARPGRPGGPRVLVRTGDGTIEVGGRIFEEALTPILTAHALSREEYAAVWFGGGPVTTWLSAAGALCQGAETTRQVRELGRMLAPEGAAGSRGGGLVNGGSLDGFVRRMIREAKEDVARLHQSGEGMEALEAQLREARGEAAEVHGDGEAGMMAWVRERQDAETRLLLYRDRERELRERLRRLDEEGDAAACGSCGQPLRDRAEVVRRARREEWEAVVQDGRWWRRRRDQLERKPDDLKAIETRAMELDSAVNELSEELERRKIRGLELEAALGRLDEFVALEARLGGRRGSAEMEETRARIVSATRERVRARIHGKVLSLTGGRLAGVFPALFADWADGGRRGGKEFAALELAVRIALAELAVDAGVPLQSVVLPAGLNRLGREDVHRALVELVRLSRRIPLLLVRTTHGVASAFPECFDLLYRVEEVPEGLRLRRDRSGLGTIWLQVD